jgi:hypothetical protein
LASARTVSSNRDFGVEQFFRADEFRAVDPSPFQNQILFNHTISFNPMIFFILSLFKRMVFDSNIF